MNADRLLAYYERIADAPDAIERLRCFILDLAVRGKLVEQDPADEPASELLKRIAAEKARLVKAGEIRQPKTLPPIHSSAIPVESPSRWIWTRLGNASTLITKGSTPTSYGHAYTDGGINFIKVEAIKDGQLRPENVTSHISEKTYYYLARSKLFEGDILFSIAGSIGTCAIVSDEILPANTNQALSIIRGTNRVFFSKFLLLCLQSSVAQVIHAKARGGAMNNISLGDVASFVIPLPPLAEQHRIVAKVDELMALCDQLEAARTKREETRDRLAAGSLIRLNDPDPDRVVFRNHAAFALENLAPLTTRTDQIKSLRQTILSLAVRGKLVGQDPNDEPAAELLKRIAAEKVGLIKTREIRKKEALPSIEQADEPFPIPPSWVWSYLGNLFHLVTDGAHHTPRYIDRGISFLSVKDVSSGTINFTNARQISEDQHTELCKRCCPQKGDILLTKVGTTGIAVPVKTERPFSIFVSVALLKFSAVELSQDYLCHLINSPFVRQQSKDNTQGIGNQNLVLRLINGFALPIPPLAEQHRIVAKVDELIALCGQLEARLNTGDATRNRLLDALLHETLDPISGAREN